MLTALGLISNISNGVVTWVMRGSFIESFLATNVSLFDNKGA